MLDKIINRCTEQLFENIVDQDFYIGIEPIKEYVKFYLIAEYIQSTKNGNSISVHKHIKDQFLPKDIESAEEAELKAEFDRVYERKIDHYNTMNFENKVDLLRRQKEEEIDKGTQDGTKRQNGNAKRYKGNQLNQYQLDEFKILDGIKEGKYPEFDLNKTYKRIVSDQGYLNKMSFREYKDFCEFLKQDIDNSEDEYKNIRYYKLEKRLNFELIKCVLKSANECRKNDIESEASIYESMIMLLHMPLIKDRQIYAEIYPTLNIIEKQLWRIEVDGITKFIRYTINYCNEILKDKNKPEVLEPELEGLKEIYRDQSYRNDYKLRKDFSADDFKRLMEQLDDNNVKVNNIVKNIYS